jgi:hypothetical protein
MLIDSEDGRYAAIIPFDPVVQQAQDDGNPPVIKGDEFAKGIRAIVNTLFPSVEAVRDSFHLGSRETRISPGLSCCSGEEWGYLTQRSPSRYGAISVASHQLFELIITQRSRPAITDSFRCLEEFTHRGESGYALRGV